MQQTVQSNQIERFELLFRGYEQGFGEYYQNASADNDGKVGKISAKTIARSANITDFTDHLNGKCGIGIIPLLLKEKCWFGAIDIDIKGEVKLTEDHFILEARICALKIPVVLCRSKSNGVHLYLFGKEPISARLVQARLIEFAAVLGYGGCEVFPKQIMRAKETDFGNWINLPYFGGKRVAIHDGKELGLDEFINAATYMAVSESSLRSFKIPLADAFIDGPPCLQQLATFGFQEGGRNNALLNAGIYFKKKYPDDWQDHVNNFNANHIDPTLPNGEVSVILKSLSKKEYNYTCKTSPLVQHCNRPQCLKRDYGISNGEDGNFKLPITGITKYIAGDSYRWGINTGEMMIDFTSEEIFSLEVYRKKFAERLSMVIPNVRQGDFLRQLTELISQCEIVNDPEDASESGQMISAVESWFLDRSSAKNHDEMIKLKWYLNPDNKKIYFTGEALEEYLTQIKRLKAVQKHKLWRLLESYFKAEKDRLVIKGKRRRVWVIPNFEFEDVKPLPARDVEKKEESI